MRYIIVAVFKSILVLLYIDSSHSLAPSLSPSHSRSSVKRKYAIKRLYYAFFLTLSKPRDSRSIAMARRIDCCVGTRPKPDVHDLDAESNPHVILSFATKPPTLQRLIFAATGSVISLTSQKPVRASSVNMRTISAVAGLSPITERKHLCTHAVNSVLNESVSLLLCSKLRVCLMSYKCPPQRSTRAVARWCLTPHLVVSSS